MTAKERLTPDFVLDHDIGITDDGRLLWDECRTGDSWRDISADPALGGIVVNLRGTQTTAYGRVKFYETAAGHLLARQTHAAGNRTCWVPLSGKKSTRPKKVKVAVAHKRGEALFDPTKYPEGWR